MHDRVRTGRGRGQAGAGGEVADRVRAREAAQHAHGRAGWAWATGGRVVGVFAFRLDEDWSIITIDVIGDPEHLRRLRIELAPL